MICAHSHSLTQAPTHALTPSLTHSLAHSLTRSLTHPHTHPYTHSHTHLLALTCVQTHAPFMQSLISLLHHPPTYHMHDSDAYVLMQLNLSTAAEAYQSVDSDDFYVQLNLTSNDTNFNNTHPRLQVSLIAQVCYSIVFTILQPKYLVIIM